MAQMLKTAHCESVKKSFQLFCKYFFHRVFHLRFLAWLFAMLTFLHVMLMLPFMVIMLHFLYYKYLEGAFEMIDCHVILSPPRSL